MESNHRKLSAFFRHFSKNDPKGFLDYGANFIGNGLTGRQYAILYRQVTGESPPRRIAKKIETDNSKGFFYALLLDERSSPYRFKLGFTKNFEARLKSHRCTNPRLQVIGTWPSFRDLEGRIFVLIQEKLGRASFVATELVETTQYSQAKDVFNDSAFNALKERLGVSLATQTFDAHLNQHNEQRVFDVVS